MSVCLCKCVCVCVIALLRWLTSLCANTKLKLKPKLEQLWLLPGSSLVRYPLPHSPFAIRDRAGNLIMRNVCRKHKLISIRTKSFKASKLHLFKLKERKECVIKVVPPTNLTNWAQLQLICHLNSHQHTLNLMMLFRFVLPFHLFSFSYFVCFAFPLLCLLTTYWIFSTFPYFLLVSVRCLSVFLLISFSLSLSLALLIRFFVLLINRLLFLLSPSPPQPPTH